MCPIFPANIFPLHYVLICPELCQAQRFSQYQCDSLHFFDKHNDIWLWNSFAKRPTDAQRVEKFQPRAGRGRLSRLENLPNELIEQILDVFLDDHFNRPIALESVLALGLSSANLWSRVLHRIHQEYRRSLPTSWAGKRIGFYNPLSYLNDNHVQNFGLGDQIFADLQAGLRNFQFVSYQPEWEWLNKIELIRNSSNPAWHWLDRNSLLRKINEEFSEREWEQIQQDLSQSYLFPQDRVWVLRNLTTREFVRSDQLIHQEYTVRNIVVEEMPVSRSIKLKRVWEAITRKQKDEVGDSKSYDRHVDSTPLALAQAFLILTIFSRSDRPSFVTQDFMFQRAPWSGHAFDLVTLEEHKASVEAQADPSSTSDKSGDNDVESGNTIWKDVSELVSADIGSIRKRVLDWDYSGDRKKWGNTYGESVTFWVELCKTREKYRKENIPEGSEHSNHSILEKKDHDR